MSRFHAWSICSPLPKKFKPLCWIIHSLIAYSIIQSLRCRRESDSFPQSETFQDNFSLTSRWAGIEIPWYDVIGEIEILGTLVWSLWLRDFNFLYPEYLFPQWWNSEQPNTKKFRGAWRINLVLSFLTWRTFFKAFANWNRDTNPCKQHLQLPSCLSSKQYLNPCYLPSGSKSSFVNEWQ